jgi:RNA polymerase sigma-70 factor (ECF subfamily)
MPHRDHDADSFVRLLTQHEPQLRSCVLLWVPNWNDAQDITQQVSVILWRKFEQYQPGTSFLAWALGIAKLEAKDYWRRQQPDRRLFTDEFVDAVAEDAVAMAEEVDHRRGLLKHCVDRLRPADRELLALRYERETAVVDIARQVGRSVEAVYKSLGRLRAALLECVGRQAALADRR